MSAGTYWIVRRNPAGGFSPVIGFASEEGDPVVRPDAPTFEVPELALASVLGSRAEYGHRIHPECFDGDADEVRAQAAVAVVAARAVEWQTLIRYRPRDDARWRRRG